MAGKFRVGDKVRILEFPVGTHNIGDIGLIDSVDDNGCTVKVVGEDAGYYTEIEIELVKEEEKIMQGRTFRLLKDMPDLKKGAIVIRNDMGVEGNYYKLIDQAFVKHAPKGDLYSVSIPVDAVEKEPKWFVEVFSATTEWMTKKELEQFKAWKKRQGKK